MKKIILFAMLIFAHCALLHSQTVIDIDPSNFLANGTNVTVTLISCTLSDGTTTTCYEIVSTGGPTDHDMGPWCPDNISDDASAGGIWLEGGEVYDVDGAFIANMANFYGDTTWEMYDANGDIYTTDTETDCANAANPNVGADYENYCVECLPSYVTDLSSSYCIPVTPVQLTSPIQFGGVGGGPGGPPGGTTGPSVRGIAFNGVVFDAPAPTSNILAAYTLAPFDDAGGHINLAAGYHYHAATGVSTTIAQSDGHAGMIGYALDGHGIYAELDANGNEYTDLDECRGHYDATRGYHYHVDYAGNNNFIDCLYGAYSTDCGEAIALPISLLNFTANFEHNKVSVNWETASEINNDHFTVERSSNGQHFESLSIIPGSNNFEQKGTYNYNDLNYLNGVSYYRLKQTDRSGEVSYSDVVVVKIDGGLIDNIHVFPNPTTDVVYVQMDNAESGNVTIEVWNIAGQVVLTKSFESSSTNLILDLQTFEKGTYVIRIKKNNEVSVHNIVLQ